MASEAKKRVAPEIASTESNDLDPVEIRAELGRILESTHFRRSKRSQEFLEFIIEKKIKGEEGLLKERLIGIELYGRNTDYATGEDPVVRVQAGEVRRRLELYYAEAKSEQLFAIELHMGSYIPIFRRADSNTSAAIENPVAANHELIEVIQPPEMEWLDGLKVAESLIGQQTTRRTPRLRATKQRIWWITAVALSLLAGLFAGYSLRNFSGRDAALKAFWEPATEGNRPVLVCLSEPVRYVPSAALFGRYTAKHPGTFTTPLDRYTRPLPLDPQETIHWSDVELVTGAGPPIGGTRAAIAIATLFDHLNMPFNVRFGDAVSFTDAREAPTVIIGALNSYWMTKTAADLHFAMREPSPGPMYIQEVGTKGRIWADERDAAEWREYALITRLQHGPSGSFTVRIEGITDHGTQAGSELVTNVDALRNVLSTLPKNWENKNIQLVIATDVIDSEPGPAKVIASYVW